MNSLAVPCGGYGGLVDGNGVLWSAAVNQSQLFRFDIAGGTTDCIAVSTSYGLGLDANGYIWNAMWTTNLVAKLSPAGVMEPGFPKPVGGSACRGVAVTLADNDVWIACSVSNSVSRLDNAGNFRKSIPVGRTPTGVAVDANGKVWVTNFDSNNAMRIDPAGDADGLGAVDLAVDLGAGATPYNYSDMTGLVAFTGTARQGTWTVVYDGGRPAIDWGNVYWTSDEPLGTLVGVEVRAADTEAGLPAVPFVPVMNGVPFYGTGVVGQYVQVRATLSRDPAVEPSPVLFDLTVEANRPPDCSTAYPSVSMLWPPNHKLVPVSVLGVTDPEGSPVTIAVTRITQDEPVNSLGDGDTSPDGAGLGTDTAWLRAERTGAVPHNGRVYRIHFTATDALGASCQGAVDVCVPHDKGERASCIDDGQFYDSTSDGRADRSTRFAGGLDVEQRPNPFNPSTSLEYSLGSATRVTVVIYNALGQQVRTLVDAEQGTGRQRAVGTDGTPAAPSCRVAYTSIRSALGSWKLGARCCS